MIHVTITGADDDVDPADLADLSAKFPFVEWALLFSTKLQGERRYPSPGWVVALRKAPPPRLAAHLCGSIARQLMAGSVLPINHLATDFHRVQINGYEAGAALPHTENPYPVEFILQARSEEALQAVAHDAIRLGRASVLFDPSGGRGIEPFRWPPMPLGVRVGFAGGIGPDNVGHVIDSILMSNATLTDFWIDMESGVRTDDRFDLGKVREVLVCVARLNAQLAEACGGQ